MANGGGGTVVFGVRDRVVGHAAALLGVPAEIDINLLQRPRGRQRCPARGPEPHPRPHHGRQPHQHPGAWALPQPFRLFVADEGKAGRVLSVEHLLVLHHLLGHPELDTAAAASLCQRTEPEARELLNDMETGLGYLERGGTGRGTYWALRPDLHRQLAGPGHPERGRRIAWEAAKTRILSVLKDRARRGGAGLSNQEIRQITHYDRNQVVRLMLELRAETPEILLDGAGRSACYRLDPARK